MGECETVHSLTCTYGLHQFRVMLGSKQGLVVAWILLELVLSSTGRHPDQSPMLVGNALPYISLYWRKERTLTFSSVLLGAFSSVDTGVFSFHTHMSHSSELFFCPSVVWTIWWTVGWAQLDSQTWAPHMTHNQSPLGAQSHMDPLWAKKHKVRAVNSFNETY